jgi:hypothetical protein
VTCKLRKRVERTMRAADTEDYLPKADSSLAAIIAVVGEWRDF